MPEGRCKKCNRLIYDTEKLYELPNVLECQHCHHVNILRRKDLEASIPGPETEVPGPEVTTEDVPAAAAPETEAAINYGPGGEGANTYGLPPVTEPETVTSATSEEPAEEEE